MNEFFESHTARVSEDPPEGFIPQTPLLDNQSPGISEREPDLIADAEAENPDAQPRALGEANDDDDIAEDGDDD